MSICKKREGERGTEIEGEAEGSILLFCPAPTGEQGEHVLVWAPW